MRGGADPVRNLLIPRHRLTIASRIQHSAQQRQHSGARGDLPRDSGGSIDAFDGEVTGPRAINGEPRS
jgi:hypothetical protein